MLLEALYEASGVAIDFYKFLYYLRGPYRQAVTQGGLAYVAELKNDQAARELKRMVWGLKRSQYLKAEKVGKRLVLSLTSSGRRLALEHKIKQAKKLPKSCGVLVLFDIPESQAVARQVLRNFLKRNGFTMLQQSVWLSRQDVFSILAECIQELRIKRFVTVVYVTKLTEF